MKRIGSFIKNLVETKLRKNLIVTSTLPHLSISCNFLAASQSSNGSWSNDILTTARVLRALWTFSKYAGKKTVFRKEIKSGIEYLKKSMEALSDEILQAEDMYASLDKKAVDFGNALFVLWLTNSLTNRLIERTRNAFLRIESNAERYIKALDNIEVACSLLSCHVIPQFHSPSEKILDFSFAQFLSRNLSPKDSFLLVIMLKTLQKNFSPMLEERWKYHVSRRTDEWKKLTLEEGVKKLLYSQSAKVYKENVEDIDTLSYCLIALNRASISLVKFQQKITERLLSSEINLFKKSISSSEERTKGKFPISLSSLSLFAWALSESPFSRVSFFPFKQTNYVISAIKWFERMQNEKIKMLTGKQYKFLLGFILILIVLTTILVYLLTLHVWRAMGILSLLLSSFYFLATQLSKK